MSLRDVTHVSLRDVTASSDEGACLGLSFAGAVLILVVVGVIHIIIIIIIIIIKILIIIK